PGHGHGQQEGAGDDGPLEVAITKSAASLIKRLFFHSQSYSRRERMPSALDTAGLEVRDAIRRHWVLFFIQGLILIAFGLLAIGEPMVATLAVTVFAGWLFLIGGIIGL